MVAELQVVVATGKKEGLSATDVLIENFGPHEIRCMAKNALILMIHTSKNIYSSRRKRLAWSLCVILMRLVFVLQSKFLNKKLKSSQCPPWDQ